MTGEDVCDDPTPSEYDEQDLAIVAEEQERDRWLRWAIREYGYGTD